MAHEQIEAYEPIGIADPELRIAHALEYIARHVGLISAKICPQETLYSPADIDRARAIGLVLELAKSPDATPEEIEAARVIEEALLKHSPI
jgi:hypothetical protein